MQQAAQVTSSPLPAFDWSGSATWTSFGPRSGRGQLSARSWGFERAAEREERGVRLTRVVAANVEREACGREEWDQWRRAKDAEEEGKFYLSNIYEFRWFQMYTFGPPDIIFNIINHDYVAKGYDEDHPEGYEYEA